MAVTLIDSINRFMPRQQLRLEKTVQSLLNFTNVSSYNVNIVLTSDQEISHFNERYRKLAAPTNVLSFPFETAQELELTPGTDLSYSELGDIIISVETAENEARQYGQSLYHRLCWLMTHGILHLLGYDHERSEADAAEMSELEEQFIHELQSQRRGMMTHLAINVDHVATIRQARGITEPDPVTAAAICELAGAKGIVVHLREDRRHIQDRDVRLLRETVQTKLNLEMGAAKEIIKFALDLHPDMVTLVPEKRQELTTEGGLDVISQQKKIARTIEKMSKAGIPVSLFIDPDLKQVKTAYDIGATYVELHTGTYADAPDPVSQQNEFTLIEEAAEEAWQLGLHVNAGHGLNYVNTAPIAALDTIEELSIGHAIISRAVFSGLDRAVRDMEKIISNAASLL
ncbi:MAG: pyridoxine 5'-phosphate synthase [Desulfocapsaceae bacterium]|jgi:pyridoxine 5-phosphate synthase|nr:pyridoxine 5'-phosphate synthase [Desulfocapsaceae bacterium]